MTLYLFWKCLKNFWFKLNVCTKDFYAYPMTITKPYMQTICDQQFRIQNRNSSFRYSFSDPILWNPLNRSSENEELVFYRLNILLCANDFSFSFQTSAHVLGQKQNKRKKKINLLTDLKRWKSNTYAQYSIKLWPESYKWYCRHLCQYQNENNTNPLHISFSKYSCFVAFSCVFLFLFFFFSSLLFVIFSLCPSNDIFNACPFINLLYIFLSYLPFHKNLQYNLKQMENTAQCCVNILLAMRRFWCQNKTGANTVQTFF